jgi:hypothetical protein
MKSRWGGAMTVVCSQSRRAFAGCYGSAEQAAEKIAEDEKANLRR